MNIVKENFFGFLLVSSLVVFSVLLNKYLSNNNILISAAFICILLGLLVGNLFPSNTRIETFINFSLKKLLRIGIALLGLSLSLTELYNYGSISLFLIIINIIIAFVIIKYLCQFFKVSNSLGYLITMGTCICGVTAVIASCSNEGTGQRWIFIKHIGDNGPDADVINLATAGHLVARTYLQLVAGLKLIPKGRDLNQCKISMNPLHLLAN